MRKLWRRLRHHREAMLIFLATSGPAILVVMLVASLGAHLGMWRWPVLVAVAVTWLCGAGFVAGRISRRYATMMTVIGAFGEGDYSVRVGNSDQAGPAGGVLRMLNALGDVLREQRLGAMEAHNLVARVLSDIDVAVFVFDSETRLRIVNRAAEALLARLSSDVLGRTAQELELTALLTQPSPSTLQAKFPSSQGVWELHRSPFRTEGALHTLVMVTDVGRVLREEEQQVFNRMVRVIGHEINNSMAPITSVATQLLQTLQDDRRPPDLESDLKKGLSLIARRSNSLNRFLSSYARLTNLPMPQMEIVEVGPWLRRLVALQGGRNVQLSEGAPASVFADADQLDQVLINLMQNAVEASVAQSEPVMVGWTRMVNRVEIWVRDEGIGLANEANIFVPFFTTKKQGSGIGLVLSRQIAEAHKGTLTLTNRQDGLGCEALLRLPLV